MRTNHAGTPNQVATVIGRECLRISLTALSFLLCLAAPYPVEAAISDITLDAKAFNPTAGKSIALSFVLGAGGSVSVNVFDADGGLIRTLLKEDVMVSGKHEIAWDGRDDSGQLVPDEAYTFTVNTGSGDAYDPFATSGGIVGDIRDAEINANSGTVVYKVPEPSRVLIRMGTKSGPMLKTLVDWKPRVAGSITEYWDGRDEDKLMNLSEHKDFSALITYVTLPNATVITYGNDKESYRDYKLGRGRDRPGKRVQPRVVDPDPARKLAPEGFVPSPASRAPSVAVTLPGLAESEKGVPSVQATLDVRVDVDPADKETLLTQQFEVIFFVDNVFFAEAERGYLPYNWRWELQQLPPGEHILTVNISSFKGQVGVGSRKIKVVKPDGK